MIFIFWFMYTLIGTFFDALTCAETASERVVAFIASIFWPVVWTMFILSNVRAL